MKKKRILLTTARLTSVVKIEYLPVTKNNTNYDWNESTR